MVAVYLYLYMGWDGMGCLCIWHEIRDKKVKDRKRLVLVWLDSA
jgi:hypothetical protein